MKVNQLTAKPTNKLTAAMVGAAVVETARSVSDALWPGLLDGPFWIAIYPLAIFGAGYFIKDAANVDLAQDGV